MLMEALDTFIGLITIFLILSLIISALGEGVSAVVNFKGSVLKSAVKRLLGAASAEDFFGHEAIERLRKPGRFHDRLPSYVPDTVFAEVLLDLCVNPPSQRQAGRAAPKKPVNANTLDRALSNLDKEYADALRALWQRADCNLETMRLLTAEWFNRTGDRSIGWFRRRLSFWLFGIGFAVALFLNADTIYLFEVLSKDEALRGELVTRATEIVKEVDKSGIACDDDACRLLVEDFLASPDRKLSDQEQAQLAGLCGQSDFNNAACHKVLQGKQDLERRACATLGVEGECTRRALISVAIPQVTPILGPDLLRTQLLDLCPEKPKVELEGYCPQAEGKGFFDLAVTLMRHAGGWWSFVWLKLIGLILTAAAVSLGAPFWFDLLQKIVQIRISSKPVVSPTPEPRAAPGTPATADVPRARALIRAKTTSEEAVEDLAHFEDKRLGFSPVNLLWSARFAKLAYVTDAALVAAELEGWGAEGTLLEAGDTQCVLAYTPKAAFIAFRGTEPKLADWLTDLDIVLEDPSWDADAGYRVHRGFNKALDAIWPKITTELYERSVFTRRLPIWICGHSLGGALATLAAVHLSLDMKTDGKENVIGGIHTFGQPRVGDQALADVLDRHSPARYFRSINHRDPVPRLPLVKTPALMEKLKNIQGSLALYEYAHAGRVIYFTDAGLAMMDPPLWYRKLDTLAVGLTMDAVEEALKDSVGDHDMGAYVRLHRGMTLTEQAPSSNETKAA